MIKFWLFSIIILCAGSISSAEIGGDEDSIDSSPAEEEKSAYNSLPCSFYFLEPDCDLQDIINRQKDLAHWTSDNSPGRKRRKSGYNSVICSFNLFAPDCDLQDIINDQEDLAHWMSDNSPGRKRRSAMTRRSVGGTNTVVYILDVLFSDWDRLAIRSAMDQIEQDTCVRWVERRNDHNFVDYVSIQSDKWCWSHLMRNGKSGCKESASSESPHRMSRGLILHELLHTLGMTHEHQRPDRNKYITVNWDNIIDGFEHKFAKDPSSAVDLSSVEYDYRSVMHYAWNTYAKNVSIPVLTPKSCSLKKEDLGHGLKHGYLTQLDIQKINKLFKCP